MSPTLRTISIWCSFCRIPNAAVAAMVSEKCLFSLETLEFACIPHTASFALTECEHDKVWRWAIIDPMGLVVGSGHEATEARAQSIAENALRVVAV